MNGSLQPARWRRRTLRTDGSTSGPVCAGQPHTHPTARRHRGYRQIIRAGRDLDHRSRAVCGQAHRACAAQIDGGLAASGLAALLRLAYLAVTNTCTLLRLPPLSDRDKDIEIPAVRHQLLVLQRQGERGCLTLRSLWLMQRRFRHLVVSDHAAANHFPGLPLVGYEHGDDLENELASGFALRIWLCDS